MKSIYKKIKISKLLILIIFLSLISGLFKDIMCFLSIIIVHEMGHIILSKIYEWNIDKISFNIYGGYITYDEIIDKSFKEELLISCAGFMFQSIYYFIIYVLFINNIINLKLFLMFKKYYLGILIFNILPIIPLDGSKILNIFLNKVCSYYKSLKILFYVSYVSLMFILLLFIFRIINIEYSYIIVFLFILISLINYVKYMPYLYNKFLYERYLYPLKTDKYIIIKNDNIKKMRRRKKHFFKINNHYYDEMIILAKKFD